MKHVSFAMIWTVTVAATAALVMTDHPIWAGVIFGIGACLLPNREVVKRG